MCVRFGLNFTFNLTERRPLTGLAFHHQAPHALGLFPRVAPRPFHARNRRGRPHADPVARLLAARNWELEAAHPHARVVKGHNRHKGILRRVPALELARDLAVQRRERAAHVSALDGHPCAHALKVGAQQLADNVEQRRGVEVKDVNALGVPRKHGDRKALVEVLGLGLVQVALCRPQDKPTPKKPRRSHAHTTMSAFDEISEVGVQ